MKNSCTGAGVNAQVLTGLVDRLHHKLLRTELGVERHSLPAFVLLQKIDADRPRTEGCTAAPLKAHESAPPVPFEFPGITAIERNKEGATSYGHAGDAEGRAPGRAHQNKSLRQHT